MVNVIEGDHYTFDYGFDKLIVFTTHKGKYEGEDAYFYQTITCQNGQVFERIYDMELFQLKEVRLATIKEIAEMRNLNPYKIERLEKWIEELIIENWNISKKPILVFDPEEVMNVAFKGAFEPYTNSLIFRSEMISVLSEEEMRKVLLHELCHWYLYETNQAYQDKDVRFAQEIIRLGIEDTINIHNKEAREAYEKAKTLLILKDQ
ncbi:M48 family metalloprotease [Brevibacillus sp. NPDC058079]|uniref:M48 family metalloprotease n=1 Tax=Brevibacillus sp. NPDC058079 TaxID=3346330 RepID=UPI0036E27DFE